MAVLVFWGIVFFWDAEEISGFIRVPQNPMAGYMDFHQHVQVVQTGEYSPPAAIFCRPVEWWIGTVFRGSPG